MKIGSLVECIYTGKWLDPEIKDNLYGKWVIVDGPQKGDICTVTGFGQQLGIPTIYLQEWPSRDGWSIDQFVEIMGVPSIEEVIEELDALLI